MSLTLRLRFNIREFCQSVVWLALSAALLWSSATWASEVQLTEVLESVNQHYPLILQTKQDLAKSQGDLLSAQGGFDPVLKATSDTVPVGYYNHNYTDISIEQPTPVRGARVYGGWRLGTGNFPLYDGKLATLTGGEARVGVEIPLLKNGAIDDRRNKILTAENGIALTQTGIALTRLETTRLATHRYWDWVASGKKLAIAENLLEIANTRDKALLHRYRKGDAPKFEHRENQRVVVQRQSLLLAADRAFQKSVFELSLYFRDAQGLPVLLKRDQLPVRFPETEAKEEEVSHDPKKTLSLVNDHPEIKRLGYQMVQNQIDLNLSENFLLPRLDIKVGYSRDLGNAPTLISSSAYSTQPLANYPGELKLGVAFEFPLFQRTAKGQTQSLQASYNRLEAQTLLMRNRIETTLLNALQAMEVAKKRVTLAQEELKISRDLEEGERVRFQHGDSQLFIVNLREQSTGEAALREVDAMAEYFNAKADYLASTAITVE